MGVIVHPGLAIYQIGNASLWIIKMTAVFCEKYQGLVK